MMIKTNKNICELCQNQTREECKDKVLFWQDEIKKKCAFALMFNNATMSRPYYIEYECPYRLEHMVINEPE